MGALSSLLNMLKTCSELHSVRERRALSSAAQQGGAIAAPKLTNGENVLTEAQCTTLDDIRKQASS